MVLPTFGSISISGINSCARFTDGNIGVNTTSPNYNVDINGTLKATTITVGIMLATTSISSGAVNATNSTVTNSVATNVSSGTLNLSTGLTAGTILATTSISSGAVNATNSTITNLVVTSNTVTNVIATNMSSATLNLSGGCTVGTARITTSLLAIGNSNTVGNIFTTGGNVGISTSSPGYTLDVNGKLQVYNNINNTSQIILSNPNSGSDATSIFTMVTDQVSTFNIFKNSTTRTVDGGANTVTIRNDGGPLRLQSNTGMGIWVGSTGNVGINTTVPGSTLDIKGNTTWGLTRLAPTTSGGETAIGFFALNDFTASTQATSGNWLLGTGINSGGASNFNLFRNTTNIISFATNGNVGIGTTSPTAKLNVVGDSIGTNGTVLITGADSFGNSLHIASQASHKRLGFNHTGTIGNIFSYDYATGPQNLILQYPGGNVGISTTSPIAKLHVAGGYSNSINSTTGSLRLEPGWIGNAGIVSFFQANGTRKGYIGYGVDNTAFELHGEGSRQITLFTNDIERMTVTSTGNVGIGTASPTYRLSVSGAGGFTGNLFVNHGGAGNTPQINVSPNTNTAESSIGFWQNTNNSGALWAIGHNPAGAGNNNFGIYSSTFGGNALSILNNGNVGINTNSPTEKLNVNGNIDLFGTVRIGGSSSSSAFLINLGTAGVGNFRSGFLFGDGTNMLLSNQQNGFLTFATNNTTRVEIAANGRVTLGGNNGSYPLTVFGSSNSGSIAGYAGWSGNYVWQNQTTSYDVSIYGQNFIMAGQGFVSVSDQRIKKDIIDIEDGESLSILRQLQPKRYRYIDEYKRGTDYVYGFIAQQVREVLPSASGLVKDVIPSIITSATVSYDSANDITTVSLLDNKQHNLTSENINSRVRFFDENDQNTDLELHEIVSGDIFKVKGELKGTNTFAYGVEVEDFHTLNKDAIFTVALAALQQVDRELQETKQTVNDLVQRIQALENARN